MPLTESTYQMELLGHQNQFNDSTGEFPAEFMAPSGHELAGERYRIDFWTRIGLKDERYEMIYDSLGREVGILYVATIKSGPKALGGVRGRVKGMAHIFSQPAAAMTPLHHVKVDSKNPNWHAGFGVDANKRYRIVPSPTDKWTLNNGVTYDHFYGSGGMNGGDIGIPANPISLGGLNVLVWHHQPDGQPALPEIVSFFPGMTFVNVSVGDHGGSMHFIIGDIANARGDNSGLCGVDVFEV
jgi:hypothetical protein